jgi:hypothetical protein
MRLTPRPLCVNILEQSRCEHACGSLLSIVLSPSCEAPRSRGAAFCGCLLRGAPSSGSCRFRSRSVSSVLIMNVQSLFVATATDGSDQPAAPRLLVIPVHPGEDAAAKQEEDWWRQLDHVLSNVDAIHCIAGKTPPRLSSLEPTDLTEIVRVPLPTSSETNAATLSAAIKHNQLVKTSHAENARKKVLLDDYKQRSARSALHSA